MALQRIAVAEGLRALAETANQRLAVPRPALLFPPLPEEARCRLRWQRVWLERRRAAGESTAETEAVLRDGSVRALLATLDRQAEAVLLATNDPMASTAWGVLEPLPGEPSTVNLFIAELPAAGTAAVVGWCDWPQPDGGSTAATAAGLRIAAAEFARLGVAKARPLAVDFFGGREERAASIGGLGEILAAHCASAVRIYSPLLFLGGRLDATALVMRLLAATRAAPPVVCAPRLPRDEFAAAVERAGGSWAGPLRAGAEIPAALAAPGTSSERLAATLHWLQRRRASS